MTNVYMDYNAHSLTREEAVDAMVQAAALSGNPSSPHSAGRKARALLEECRAEVADFCGASGGGGAENVIFTSSGTEANALAMRLAPEISERLSPTWLISAVEHISVPANAPQHKIIKVNDRGEVCLEDLERQLQLQLAQSQTPYVSVQVANNETGVIQPIGEIAALVKAHNGFLHCDAVQAAGKIPLDIGTLGVGARCVRIELVGAQTWRRVWCWCFSAGR